MHVLVTGINGQIGSRLSRHLSSQNIEHRGVDTTECFLKVPFLRCDLTDDSCLGELRKFVKPVTHVIHLAGKISTEKDFISDLQPQFEISVVGTINLLSVLSTNVTHVSYASSMVVYGTPKSVEVDELSETSPEKSYAYGKLAAEMLLEYYGKTNKTPVALMRLSSVYGPGRVTSRAIPSIIENVLNGERVMINGTGATIRDYVYIDDICDMMVKTSIERLNGVYNLSSGKGTSLKQLSEIIFKIISEQSVVSSEIEFRTERLDGYSIILNRTKLNKELGHSCINNTLSGLRKTVQWHKTYRLEEG